MPSTFREKVFHLLHNLSHPGIRATTNLIASRLCWDGMMKDVRTWAKNCVVCQRATVQQHNKAPIGSFSSPDARFSHVHLDLVGPLPLSNGQTFLLTCVDRLTRWAEAIPISDSKTETVVRAFLYHWVARFGSPQYVTTHRGVQFESSLFRSLTHFLGCERFRTTAYHPAANGLVERFHRHLKSALMARQCNADWTDHLPFVLLGIRTTLKADLGCSAAELVYGTTLRLPGEMFSPSACSDPFDATNLLHRLRQFFANQQPVPTRQQDPNFFVDPNLQSCSHVFVRCDRVKKPLQPPYNGPFEVLRRGEKTFSLQMNNKVETVSGDRLKAASLESSPTSHLLPSQRPPLPPPPSVPPLDEARRTKRGRRVHFPERYQG